MAAATDLVASPTLIRLDTDASRLCAIMKIWVGLAYAKYLQQREVYILSNSTYLKYLWSNFFLS